MVSKKGQPLSELNKEGLRKASAKRWSETKAHLDHSKIMKEFYQTEKGKELREKA